MRTLCIAVLVAGCIPEPGADTTGDEPARSGDAPNDAALYVAPAVVCMDTEAGSSAMGGDILLSQTVVTLALQVMNGMVSGDVTLKNSHPTESLEIKAFSLTGSTDWHLIVTAPCDVLPCTLGPNDMVNLTFNFSPSVIGEADGMLTIGSCDPDEGMAEITLDGTGLGTTLGLATTVSPPVSLGLGPIGSPLPGHTFTFFNNPATQPLPVNIMVTNTTIPPTFTANMAGATIPMNGTQDIVVTCTPRQAGTVSGTLIVAGMATYGSPQQVDVECTGTSGTLSVAPNTIALGDVRIDGAGFRTVETVLLNTTGSPLTVAAGHPIEQPAIQQVALTPATPQTIVMGPGSMFNVSFDPGNVEGPVSTTIELTAGGEMASIPFSANVVRAVLDEPANVNFGSLCVGKPLPPPQDLTIKSTGSATIHMAQRPELEMMAGSPFSLLRVAPTDSGYPTDLATNDEASVRVEVKPGLDAGSYVDYVAWKTDATSPRTKLEVSFVDDAGGISPGAVMFDAADVKQTAAPRMVTVTNCAMGDMTLAIPVFDPPGEFRVISAVPATLAPNESATLTLVFMPQGSGVRMSQMTIPTSTGDLVVTLTGTGLGDPSARGGPASLYACDCSSGDPVSGFVIVFALVVPLIPRRRRH
jgi:hypothetical protein